MQQQRKQSPCHLCRLMLRNTVKVALFAILGGVNMFKLGKNSIVVQTWFSAVMNGIVAIEKVPVQFGIREGVQTLLDELNAADAQ